MKKLFFAILALAAIASPASSSAQPWSGGARLSIDIPTGTFGKVASPGLGYGSVIGYSISPSVMLNASFMSANFNVDVPYSSQSEQLGMIYLDLGGRYMFGGRGDSSSMKLTPFVSLGVGGYLIIAGDLPFALGIAPSAGIMIPLPAVKGGYLVPAVKYHAVLTDNETTYFLGLNVGVEGNF